MSRALFPPRELNAGGGADGTKLVPSWGGSDPRLDWHAAAKRCCDPVLAANPNRLIVLEGLEYGSDLRGPWTLPLELSKPRCLVWSAHDDAWFQAFRRYLYAGDIDWAYWALNGTQARAAGRKLGAEETYGVLDVKWEAAALRQHLGALRGLQPAYSGP